MASKRFQFNKADFIAWCKDALKVLAPYLIVIIPVLLEQVPKDWAYSAIVIFLLQRARKAIELYVAGK
jgi:hypothetical protein